MKVTQVKSKNGSNKQQLDTLRSLGLRRIGHTVEVKDTPQSRGMVHRVRHCEGRGGRMSCRSKAEASDEEPSACTT